MHRYMTSPSHCQEPIYEWKYSKHTQCNPSISPHSIPPKQACNSLSPRTKIDLEFHFPLFYMNYERYSRRIYFLTNTAHVSEFRLLLVFPSKSYKLASIWHRIHVCRLESVESIATGRKSISFRVAIFFSVTLMRRKIASGFRTTWLDIVSLFWRPHGYDVIYAMHQSVVSESLYGDALLVCTSAACMQMSLTHDCHCISGFSQHTMLSVVQSLWTIVCCGVALYIVVNESNPSSM